MSVQFVTEHRTSGTVTMGAGEIGFDVVNRSSVTFTPRGQHVPIRGRLVELVPPQHSRHFCPPDAEAAPTLYVVPDGTKSALAFPVPRSTPVVVTVDPA
jgi:hypothetical protein